MIIDPKQWHDISNESERTYHYPDGSEFTVYSPLELNIQTSSMGGHSHRIKSKTAGGFDKGTYIRPGWNAISWISIDGAFKF